MNKFFLILTILLLLNNCDNGLEAEDKINPETGKTFKQERLDLLDEAEAKILGARKKTKQIYIYLG